MNQLPYLDASLRNVPLFSTASSTLCASRPTVRDPFSAPVGPLVNTFGSAVLCLAAFAGCAGLAEGVHVGAGAPSVDATGPSSHVVPRSDASQMRAHMLMPAHPRATRFSISESSLGEGCNLAAFRVALGSWSSSAWGLMRLSTSSLLSASCKFPISRGVYVCDILCSCSSDFTLATVSHGLQRHPPAPGS
ncbi:hypothetical protein OH77DRAFT_705670 [Trametes cingulata]|nr:hypothetical protein OH77DRAFT_705670 [Trametes cingulata]